GFGVLPGGIADVAALGVRDDEEIALAADVGDGGLHVRPALVAEGLVEGEVELVGHREVVRHLHDGFVVRPNRVAFPPEMLRHHPLLGIEAHAEQALLAADGGDELRAGHAGQRSEMRSTATLRLRSVWAAAACACAEQYRRSTPQAHSDRRVEAWAQTGS